MTNLEFLRRVKNLLRGIKQQRTYLLKTGKSHIESDWAKQELANITYATGKLVDAHKAKAYIERKETALRYLIPTTNKKRHNELRELIEHNLN